MDPYRSLLGNATLTSLGEGRVGSWMVEYLVVSSGVPKKAGRTWCWLAAAGGVLAGGTIHSILLEIPTPAVSKKCRRRGVCVRVCVCVPAKGGCGNVKTELQLPGRGREGCGDSRGPVGVWATRKKGRWIGSSRDGDGGGDGRSARQEPASASSTLGTYLPR